jgi:membrane protein DedA with SNARE-associated domain
VDATLSFRRTGTVRPPPPLAALLYIASSITEPVVDFATNVIGDLGLAGIFILMLLDSACIPTSSEAIMLFAGFEVSDGRFTMFEIVTAGVLGNLVGSWIAYGIGYYGRVELLEKHGKWLHITPKHLAWADRWFERYGGPTVFFSRMLPVIRTFISLPAGVARMPFWRFTALSIAGIIPWVLAFGLVGEQVGDRWDEWQQSLHYADYVILAAIAGGVIYLLIRRRRGRSAEPTNPVPDTTT